MTRSDVIATIVGRVMQLLFWGGIIVMFGSVFYVVAMDRGPDFLSSEQRARVKLMFMAGAGGALSVPVGLLCMKLALIVLQRRRR